MPPSNPTRHSVRPRSTCIVQGGGMSILLINLFQVLLGHSVRCVRSGALARGRSKSCGGGVTPAARDLVEHASKVRWTEIPPPRSSASTTVLYQATGSFATPPFLTLSDCLEFILRATFVNGGGDVRLRVCNAAGFLSRREKDGGRLIFVALAVLWSSRWMFKGRFGLVGNGAPIPRPRLVKAFGRSTGL